MTQEQIFKVLREKEWNVQRARAGLFIISYLYQSYAQAGYDPMFCSFNFEHGDHDFCQIIQNGQIAVKNISIYNNYLKGGGTLDKLMAEHEALTTKLENIWKKYQPEKNKDKEYFFTFFKDFMEVAREWWKYGAIGEDKGDIVNIKVVPYFQERLKTDQAKAREAVFALALPEEKSAFTVEHTQFLEICLSVIDKIGKKKIDQKIEAYLKDNFWFKSDFYRSKVVTKKSLLIDVAKKIKKDGKGRIKDELKKIRNNYRITEIEKKKILKKISFNKRDKINIEFAKRIITWFDRRKTGMSKQFYYLMTMLEDICKLRKIDYDKLANYFDFEMWDFLENGKRVGKKNFKRREEGILLMFKKNQRVQVFYGKIAQKMFELGARSDSEEISGVVASLGQGEKKLVGTVKIALNPDKTDFKKGEILVTSMTRVEFVPLMRKAKAIITDEGGMACHAAIVSRELGLPAIIGTKNATRKLKNGDKVEMDLKSGIIKIAG